MTTHKVKTEARALALVQRVYPSAQIDDSFEQYTRIVNQSGRIVAEIERVSGGAPFAEVTIF